MAQRSNSDVARNFADQAKARVKSTRQPADAPRGTGGGAGVHSGQRSSSACCPRQLEDTTASSLAAATSDPGSSGDAGRSPGVCHRRGRSAEPRLEKMNAVHMKGLPCGIPAGTFLEVPPVRSELAKLKETIPEVDEGKGGQQGLFDAPGKQDAELEQRDSDAGLSVPDDPSKFQSLQRILSRTSATKVKDHEPCSSSSERSQASVEPSVPGARTPTSPTRQVIIRDSAMPASPQGVSSPLDQPVPQTVVSVDRMECLRKEAATMSVERQKKNPKHDAAKTAQRSPNQAVTVTRSRTWSFPDKLMESVQKRRAVKPKTLAVRQTSLLESEDSDGPGFGSGLEEDADRASVKQRGGENVVAEEPHSPPETQQSTASEVKTQDPKATRRSGLSTDEKEQKSDDHKLTSKQTDTKKEEVAGDQREVIIRRDEKGYGLTVTGDNPVYVQSIKENGSAARAGVQQGDQIVKVNGIPVVHCNHIEVVKLIKSNSSATLTLIGQPSGPDHRSDDHQSLTKFHPASHQTANPTQLPKSIHNPNSTDKSGTSRKPSSSQASSAHHSPKLSCSSVSSIPHDHLPDRTISGPRAVNHDKDLEFKAQKAATIQMMLKQVQEEYEKMKQDYRHNPTEQLQLRLEVKTQMMRRVEDQLRTLTAELAAAAASTQPASVTKNGKVEHPGAAGANSWSGDGRGSIAGLPPLQAKQRKERRREATPGSENGDGDAEASLESGWSDDSTHLSSGSNTPSREYIVLPGFKLSASVSSRSSQGSVGQLPTDVAGSPPQAQVISIEDDDYSGVYDDQVNDRGIFSDLVQLKANPAHLAVFLHFLISNSDPTSLLFHLITDVYPTGTMKEMRKWAYEIHSSFLVEGAPLRFHVNDAAVAEAESTLRSKHDKEDAMRNIFASARRSAEADINDLLADFRSKRALGLGSLYGDHELKDSMERATELKVVDRSLWAHFERFAQNEESDRCQQMASALATFFKQCGLSAVKNNSLLERQQVFVARDKKVFKFAKATKKAYFVKGHNFAYQQYFMSTFCQQCQRIIGGIGNQGYQCANCEMNIHTQCRDSIREICSTGSLRKKRDKERRPTSVFEKIISRKPSMNLSLPARESVHSVGDESLLTPATASVGVQPSLIEEAEDAERRSLGAGARGTSSDASKSEDESKIGSKAAADGDGSPSPVVEKITNYDRVRSESFTQRPELRASVRRARSDVTVDSGQGQLMEPIAGSSDSSSNSSLSMRSGDSASNSNECLDDISNRPPGSFGHKPHFNDSDFEVEAELLPLEAVIPKELLRKLKPKEKKRQEVINELFHTERAHVRNLKVMSRLFYQPMNLEAYISSELVPLLFPNLEEVIEIHVGLNNDFKARKIDSPVVGDIAHILLKHFSGAEGEKLKLASARFCQHQSHALEILRMRQRKEQKLALFLQEAASHPLCRRLELKDLIPTVMQRLTKYPLLIDNLLKYTMSNIDEYDLLLRAHECSKEILNYVNRRVQECENHQRLVDLQRRLDRRPIENSTRLGVAEFKKLDLTRHTMIYEGELTWRISRNKQIDLHVVLLEDILVLLQKQDDRLVMRCQSTNVVAGKEDTKFTHSPVIKLSSLLTRNVATDKRALFLVSTSDYGPQIYELVASSKDEKNRWFKYITDAADAYKSKESTKSKRPAAQQSTIDPHSSFDETIEKNTKTSSENDEYSPQRHDNDDEDADKVHRLTNYLQQQPERELPVGRVEVLLLEESELVQPDEVKVSLTEVVDKAEATAANPLDIIREKNRIIETALTEKKHLVSNILQIPVEHYDHISEVVDELKGEGDFKELLLNSLSQTDALTQLINDRLDETLISRLDQNLSVDESDVDPLLTPTPSPRLFSRSFAMEKGQEPQQSCYLLPTPQSGPDAGHQVTMATAAASAKEFPILVSASQLMTISGRLRNNLTQLMELVTSQEKAEELRGAELAIHERKPSSLYRQSVVEPARKRFVPSDASLTEEIELSLDRQEYDLPSLSIVHPMLTEKIEIIGPESIVTLNSNPTMTSHRSETSPTVAPPSSSKSREDNNIS